jgi:transposase
MTAHEQLRLQHWRLKIIQEATARPRNIAPVCRRYHISRQTFYKWHKRYLAKGEEGLRDFPQGPHHCPRATHPDIVDKILHLRQHYGITASVRCASVSISSAITTCSSHNAPSSASSNAAA